MRQRGRHSAEALAINNVDGSPLRLTAPAGLNTKERVLFEQLVHTTSPRHFRASDVSLLVAFVQAIAVAQAGPRFKQGAEWEKATRMMASLATRLRLTPQSRSDPKTIARSNNQMMELRRGTGERLSRMIRI